MRIEVEPLLERSFNVVAYEGDARIGFAYVHELPRLDGRRQYLVYEVDVEERHRGRGVATALLARVRELAAEHGIAEGFVLTEPDNAGANALYLKAGGVRSEVVMWDFAYTGD